MRTRKTYSLILALAARMPQFQPSNLTPALMIDQARRNCVALANLGELEVVKKGKAGRFATETVYRLKK